MDALAFIVPGGILLALGALTGFTASRRRRNPWLWAVLGALLPLFAFVPLLILSRGRCPACGQTKPIKRTPPERSATNLCPVCGNPPDGSPETGTWLRMTLALLVMVAMPASCIYPEIRANQDARAFCDQARPGMPFGPIAKAAETSGEPRLRHIEADRLTVGYIGLPPFSRFLCTVTAQSGVITRAETTHMD